MNKNNSGFTLIELAIVLVIIGLVVGGVLAGRELIEVAKNRSLISDKDKLQAAIFTFRGKYGYVPGDFPRASSFLNTGSMEGSGDGNGNGVIDDYTSAAYPIYMERFFIWWHLYNANLLDFKMPPYVIAEGFTGGIAATKMPALHYSEGLLITSIYQYQIYTYSQTWPPAFAIGGYNAGTASNETPLLNPQTVYAIDTKIDDGLPGKGNVRVLQNQVPSWWGDSYACATTTDANTAVYNATLTDNTCFMFWFGMY